MSPFKPSGDQARWVYAYEVFRNAQDDEVVEYKVLATAMDLDSGDPSTKAKVQQAAQRAGVVLERDDRRAIKAVRGRGYKVVVPEAQLELAEHHHRKAGRSLSRGHSKLVNVDLARVTDPEARKAFGTLALAFSQQMETNRRIEKKIRKHDWALEQLQQETQQVRLETSSDVEELRGRQDKTDALLQQIAERLGVVTPSE